MERKYLTPEFYDILHSKSKFTDVVSIKNSDIKIEEKPIIEYILSNIFRGVKISDGDYAKKFSSALKLEHFRAEATFCIEHATEIIKKRHIRFPKGTVIQFVDENPFLGGQNNAYGKLIMEKCCTDISYNKREDLIYDIYLAGETLKSLYITFPADISNNEYAKCKSYFDIINLLGVYPFDELCKQKNCIINPIDRNLFFQIYADKQFDWIRDELRFPDIFKRIFTMNFELIKESAQNNAKVATFRQYLVRIADKDEKNKELFYSQINAELGIYPYSDMVLNFADQIYRLCEFGGYKLAPVKPNLAEPVATISDPEFSKQTPIIVYRYENQNSPETRIFAFDGSSLGFEIIKNLFTRFLGANDTDIYYLLNKLTYQQAEKSYSDLSKYFIRNKIAISTLTSFDIWINQNRDQIPKYIDKKIVYNYDMNFLGGSDNFFGKAFEKEIKNAQVVSKSPVYNPQSPVYNPQSPVYNPQSPEGYKSKSPEKTKLTQDMKNWVIENMENIRSTLEELEKISPNTNQSFFVNVFFKQFFSRLNISESERTRISRVAGYEYMTRGKGFDVEKMLVENNIVDVIQMYPNSYIEEFVKIKKQGREILKKPITSSFFWQVIGNLAEYVASITNLPEDDTFDFSIRMVVNNFDISQKYEELVKKFSTDTYDEKTTNKINFWNRFVNSMDNPTHNDALIVKIRQVIKFPENNDKSKVKSTVFRLLTNYVGDVSEVLKIMLEIKDYTTPYAIDYIKEHKGNFKSLEHGFVEESSDDTDDSGEESE